MGGHQEENLGCWLVCVKGRNRQAPGEPQRAGKDAGSRRDVRGGAGQLSPGRRGRGALGRGWVPPTAQGKCSRAQQRPLGFSSRVRAGQTPGCAGSGAGREAPARVNPLRRVRRPWAVPGRRRAYETRASARRAGATPTGGSRRARGQPPSAERRDHHPPAGRRGPVSAHREKGDAPPEGGRGKSSPAGGQVRREAPGPPVSGGESPRRGAGHGARF